MRPPGIPSLPIVLGLLAAATWGAADFAGGLATRRTTPSRVVLIAHGFSFVLLAGLAMTMPSSLPPWSVAEGLLSGIAGGVALMVFYEALAMGAMGLSAALAGVLTAILPVVLSIRREGLPGPLPLTGFGLALIAIILIAYAPPAAPADAETPVDKHTGRKALLFAMIAGVGFGLQLILLHSAAAAGTAANGSTGPGASFAPVLRALALSRLGGVVVAGSSLLFAGLRGGKSLLPRTPAVHTRLALPLPLLAILAGLLDTTGNGFYMFSSLGGRLDIAAVLSSLYPGGTIALAALLLHERANRLQAIGMGVALLAVAFIAA